MTQQKNFGFGEDEAMLRDAAAKFFADNASADKIHGQVAHDSNIHRDIESRSPRFSKHAPNSRANRAKLG